jgi:hypothetical protein
VDSRPQSTEDEPVKSDYARHVEWISGGFAFFSSGLIALFPFYVFSFQINDYSTVFFYAFLVCFYSSFNSYFLFSSDAWQAVYCYWCLRASFRQCFGYALHW